MSRNGVHRLVRDQIFELFKLGKSKAAIALALGISRNTVKKYLRENSAIHLPEKAKTPAVDGGDQDWQNISRLLGKGVTIKQLHADYGHPDSNYYAFRRKVIKHCRKASVVISVRQEHEPGRAVQIDFAKGINIYNVDGSEAKTELFCSVLPFSSKVYAEFVQDQKLPSFLAAQERMWRYFGGVTEYAVIDNLKSGVSKAHFYDPEVNPTYVDFSNHYKFAVLPCRPYHPKDKAVVEATIGVIQRSFYQQVRERRFYSLKDLNEALRLFLELLNNQIMSDYQVSRNQRFAEEMPKLQPLPANNYEMAEWKEAKVHPDCCIQLKRNFYSVPHIYVSQTVRVKLTANFVSIYNSDLDLIAAHERRHKPSEPPAIDLNHYPEHKMQISSYEMQQIRKSAQQVGQKTTEFVEKLFSDPRPLRNLRKLQGIMRIYKNGKVSREAMEYASAQSLTYKRYRLKYFESCATSFDNNKHPRIVSAPCRQADEIYIHSQLEEKMYD